MAWQDWKERIRTYHLVSSRTRGNWRLILHRSFAPFACMYNACPQENPEGLLTVFRAEDITKRVFPFSLRFAYFFCEGQELATKLSKTRN